MDSQPIPREVGLEPSARIANAPLLAVALKIPLLAFIGWNDRDLLPHFLRHYRELGISSFHFALHGAWDGETLDGLDRQGDVDIAARTQEPFSELLKCGHLNELAHRFRNQWVVCQDADEFLELPLPSLRRTVACLQRMGSNSLSALVVQRHSRTGTLPEVHEHSDLSALLPLYNFNLSEDMGVALPVWKVMFPLALVTEDFRISRGNHFPPSRSTPLHVPIRGVVHHFKWRSALDVALKSPRGAEANQAEQDAYRRWLQKHDKLPLQGARECSTEELRSRGLLVTPDPRQESLASLIRKTGSEALTTPLDAVTARLAALPQARVAFAATSAQELTDPRNLLLKPGQIAFVSFELAGPDSSGGIGTAIGTLAELLRSAGHEVHVVYCPYRGDPNLWHGWHEYWHARGITLHYLPRLAKYWLDWPSFQAFSTRVADLLETLDVDVLHLVDADAYGAVTASRRAAGQAFSATQIVTTLHGSMAWDRRGNGLPETLEEVGATNYLKTRACVAVVPSLRDNSPYTVYRMPGGGCPRAGLFHRRDSRAGVAR